MTVLVYGLGRSGFAVADLAARQGEQVVWFDRRAEGDDLRRAEARGWPRCADPSACRADVCIAAPGVPIDHPDLVALRRRGIETIGEVEWVHRTVDAAIVGVTGTAGKGTVTALLTAMLREAGSDAVAGGNLDPALAAVAAPGRVLVAELSSFQLERCPTLAPRVAVVLNLGRDHLDRHGSVEAYHAAKHALIANVGADDAFVHDADDPTLASWAADCAARPRGFSKTGPAPGRIQDGHLWLDDTPLLATRELALPGTHQQANGLAAALAAREMGAGDDAIRRALRAFTGLPGRHALVGEHGGVRFVDDSIATRELAVAAALEAAPAPIAWIGGGRDKGADVAPLEVLVRDKVRLFVGIGTSGPALAARLDGLCATRVVTEPDGRAALAEAVRLGVEALGHDGGTVLLAPLAASFDQFADYAARGRAFRDAVAPYLTEPSWTASS